ncbi:MAG: hypothetical protein ACK5XN_21140, partial [Bacteroidota bacterium]
MAPPVLMEKNPDERKKNYRKLRRSRVVSSFGRELSKEEFDYYKENAPEVLRNALANGSWIAPGGTERAKKPSSTTPTATATPAPAPTPTPAPVPVSTRDKERAQARQQARQTLNNLLKNNPELTSSDYVMLPDGTIRQRPTPDVSLKQAQDMVSAY